MKPMYILMDGDDFILPRLPIKCLTMTDWTEDEVSDMHIDAGQGFTNISFRFDTIEEATALKRQLEHICLAIINYYETTIKKYPHMEDIYDKYLEHHKQLKLEVVKVTFTTDPSS